MNNDQTGEQDYFMNDAGGDDFQADFEPEEEPEPVCIPKAAVGPSQTNISHVIATSSNPPKKRGPQRTKDAVKR